MRKTKCEEILHPCCTMCIMYSRKMLVVAFAQKLATVASLFDFQNAPTRCCNYRHARPLPGLCLRIEPRWRLKTFDVSSPKWYSFWTHPHPKIKLPRAKRCAQEVNLGEAKMWWKAPSYRYCWPISEPSKFLKRFYEHFPFFWKYYVQ